MMKIVTSVALAVALAATPVLAQTTAPKSPMAPTSTMDPAAEAKFKSADKDGNGTLSGAEVTAYKADMARIDANKDGSVSRDEFASAVKTGVIK